MGRRAGAPCSSQGALRILILGFLVNAIADVGYGPLLLQGAYNYATWPTAFWSLAYVCVMVGAHYQLMRAPHADE